MTHCVLVDLTIIVKVLNGIGDIQAKYMIFGSQKWRAHDPMPSTSSIYDTVVTAILFHLQIQDMKLDMKPLISVKLMKWLNCRGD